MREWQKTHPDGWLLARGYDDNRYGRHLSRDELDLVSAVQPIAIRHVSGHAGVTNSAALAAAKVSEDVEDPQGGCFARDDSGRLNGVLMERAWDAASSAIPKPSFEQMVEAILAAGDSMAGWGIVA